MLTRNSGHRIGRFLIVTVGLVNLVPAAGVISRTRVEELYGVTVGSKEIDLLLRHRAVFFGLVGIGLIAGAFIPRLRVVSIVAGVLSMGSYVALAEAVDASNERLDRVSQIDIALLLALGIAAVLTRTDSDV